MRDEFRAPANYLRPAPPTLASPADLTLAADIPLRWYLPGLFERLALMRWRLLLFVPAIVVAACFAAVPMWPVHYWQLALAWWKGVVIAVALPTTAAAGAARHALRLRAEPFCIHCGYNLTGLANGQRCPECGQPINLQMTEEYRRDPHWFIRRYHERHNHPPATAGIAALPTRRRSRDGT